jgi:hypothetical protein
VIAAPRNRGRNPEFLVDSGEVIIYIY